MKARALVWRAAFFVLCFLFLISCQNGSGNHAPTITNVGWTAENIHSTYFTKTGALAPASAFRVFYVRAADPDGDIDTIIVASPDATYWTLCDREHGINHYNSQYGYWGGSLYYSSSDPHAVLLGDYTVSVFDSEGDEATGKLAFTQPGATTTGGKLSACSEDNGGLPANATSMIKRAAIVSGTNDGTTIKITFHVTDNRIYNGSIWFYDDKKQHAVSVDSIRTKVNGGLLNNSGVDNILELDQSDLGAFTIGSVDGFHVHLTDGGQYAPKSGYDHGSISEYKEF